MAKLLASDYDGTLNSFDYDVYLNIPFIKKFMNKGNIFVLNTGRPYESIKTEINKFNIPYNYLSCNDGNLLLNSQNKILTVTSLDNQVGEYIKKLCLIHNVRVKEFDFNDHILEYEICFRKESLVFLSELKQICQNNNLIYKYFPTVFGKVLYVMQNGISKSHTINYISELENINKCDIFTIGDNANDIEMIRDFNGYTLPWGKKAVKEVSSGIHLTVASLVKKIMR